MTLYDPKVQDITPPQIVEAEYLLNLVSRTRESVEAN